jgi:hypothetical protein
MITVVALAAAFGLRFEQMTSDNSVRSSDARMRESKHDI